MNSSARLFLALWPTAEVRDTLAAHAEQWRWPAQARRTPPERFHLTLHFIGNVETARMAEVRDALRVDFHTFSLRLTQPEVWKGGIAVLEAPIVPPTLAMLHRALAARLRDLELPVEERPLRVHATLARNATGAKPPDTPVQVDWPAADGYALVQSLPGGRGYDTIARYG